ncbi:MAG: hypothetical protein AB7G06_05115 [Bdellovibrionales bacterium]
MMPSAQISTSLIEDHDLDDDDLLPDRLLNGYELEGLVRTLARQQATAVRQLASDGALLYEISERWAIGILKNDPSIKCVDDAFSFELALKEPDIGTILVSGMAQDVLDRFCKRAPRSKTIFIDVSK